MSDGTVKVTAEANLHVSQLLALLQGPLSDVLSQINAHGLALTDPNVWAGPAASMFANQVWPEVQTQLDSVRGSLGTVQTQVSGILTNVTQAGAGLVAGAASTATGLVGSL